MPVTAGQYFAAQWKIPVISLPAFHSCRRAGMFTLLVLVLAATCSAQRLTPGPRLGNADWRKCWAKELKEAKTQVAPLPKAWPRRPLLAAVWLTAARFRAA
jgi:hypothetical protein